MWHCQSQCSGSGGGGGKSGLRSDVVRSIELLLLGGEVGGVSGNWGEKGDGGMARLEDLNGFGVMVSSRCIVLCVSVSVSLRDI